MGTDGSEPLFSRRQRNEARRRGRRVGHFCSSGRSFGRSETVPGRAGRDGRSQWHAGQKRSGFGRAHSPIDRRQD